jgi:uncharacterized protein (DUF697 family)
MALRTVWQIGKPLEEAAGHQSTAAFLQQCPWTAEFDYQVAADADPIQRPHIPYGLSAPDAPKRQGRTEKLNIHFTLERDYAEGELRLIYGRYGTALDQIRLDGVLLAQVQGAGDAQLRRSELPLGVVARGAHVLTLTTAGEPHHQAHALGYLQLQALETSASSTALVPVGPAQTLQPEPPATLSTVTEHTGAGTQRTLQDAVIQIMRRQKAVDVVKSHVIGAMAIGTLPVPLLDFAALTALQLRMITRLSRLYGVPFQANRGTSLVTSLLGALLPPSAGWWVGSLTKLVPGLGLATGIMTMSTVSGASTYAVGQIFIRHFEAGHTLSSLRPEDLRQEARSFMQEGADLQARLRRGRL